MLRLTSHPARQRRSQHERRIAAQPTGERRLWQTLAWVQAEAARIVDPAELDALVGQVRRVAAEWNERSGR